MFTLYIIFCVKVRVFIRLRSWEFIEHAGGIWSSVVESKRRETSYNLYKELFEKQHNKYTKKHF